MRILIQAAGSHGDMLPFIGLGDALRRRGHDVRLYGNASFEAMAREAQLPFVVTSAVQEMQALLEDSRVTDSRAGLRLIGKAVIDNVERGYEAMASDVVPGQTLLVGSLFAFAPRLLAETHQVPFAAVHLAPSAFRSEYLAPRISAMGHLERWPRWLKRGMLRVIDRRFLDPIFCAPLNEIRARLRLPPIARVLHAWVHQATVCVGMFPEWLAPRQPDWPIGLQLTGFPMYDGVRGRALSQELEAFLAAGAPPIVFTAGTANAVSRRFYAESVQACRLLGRRGVVVAQRRDQLPSELPDGLVHVAYAPFGALFARSAAVVHHGGIGTLSQALQAGVPQLIQPMAYDQFDNASRACSLGVATELLPRAYRAPRVAQALQVLIDSSEVRASCERVAADMVRNNGIEDACDALLNATAGKG